ncbi:class I SAM-dependent methyltransferase [Paraburkholderia hayleyella]|uniref:class I SAM-dependent methyltransferase n=1 Tax=Paraburkholderia hayleyella TaxID=2152889 RepID=UPI0012914BEB|nr:methyltransferase domain-containing protein [Paraburkholderia hayleyella]
MDLKETDILGADIGKHWYYRSKARAMEHLLGDVTPSIILDVGAGSGFFSRKLLSNTSAKQAWCVDISYEADSETLEAGKPVYFRRSVDEVDADLVLLMDVLEHVDDDVGLLNDYVKKVPHGTRFLISVPAFQFLWSGHDVFLEHKRRYRLNQIEDVVRRAGLTVKRGSYYFGAIFPIAVVIRIVTNLLQRGHYKAQSQLSQHHPFVNGTLAALSSAELPLFLSNRVAGLSVFVLAEKS